MLLIYVAKSGFLDNTMKPVTGSSHAAQVSLCAAPSLPTNTLRARNVYPLRMPSYEELLKENEALQQAHASWMKVSFLALAALLVSACIHFHQYTELTWCHRQ